MNRKTSPLKISQDSFLHIFIFMHKVQFCLIWKYIKDKSSIKSVLAPSEVPELSPRLTFGTRLFPIELVGKLKVPSFQQSSWKVREPH